MEVARPPSAKTEAVLAQVDAWCWLDRVEEAMEATLRGVRVAKRMLEKANAKVEGLDTLGGGGRPRKARGTLQADSKSAETLPSTAKAAPIPQAGHSGRVVVGSRP